MKLAFSTLGCPGWSWDDIFAAAADLGFQGIEVRGVGDELFAPKAAVFGPAGIARVTARLKQAGIEIPVLTSGIALTETSEKEIFLEAEAYFTLAEKLGARYLRVMITSLPQPEGASNLGSAAAIYRELCLLGARAGVTPLLETNGPFADTARLSAFLDTIDCDNRGALWDLHHPFRFCGEPPAQSLENLGGYVKHVHVKDSLMKDGRVVYRMQGFGDVPVPEALRALAARGYDGYLSLEWVKRWNPDLEEPGVVFSHYRNYMGDLLAQA